MTIQDAIAYYKNNISSCWKDENYKWIAMKHFQDNWNIDAEDFAEMLAESFGKASNLLSGGMYYPYKMICNLARMNPEKVRQMFLNLYNEELDMEERLQPFRSACEELMEEYKQKSEDPGKARNHYQDLRALCVYLSFRYPEKYFLYKYQMYNGFKKLIDFQEISKKSDPEIRKYDNYNRMCQAVLLEIGRDTELQKMQRMQVDSNAEYYEDPEFHLLAQTIIYVNNGRAEGQELVEKRIVKGAAVADEDIKTKHYWIYSPGDGASFWKECSDKGIMVIGWDEIGDLQQYTTKTEMKQAMKDNIDPDRSFTNDAHATWQFVNEIQIGDVIFAKKGMHLLIGRGIVESAYEYDSSRKSYRNTRKVNWTHNGEWLHPGRAVMKTLTDITPYTDYVEELNALFESDMIDDVEAEEIKYPPYRKEDFLEQVFMDENSYNTLSGLVRNKKNVILQGAPGVGKTFAAKRLAYSMIGVKDPNRVMMVQFHQSYSYEDFIMGFRPSEKGFELKRGAFYNFCKNAEIDSENEYFFIIDEINRGNLSKIFGELFMLIEADKRGVELQLLYSDEKFFVPDNVYIIGMMNTADRSLAMLDYALRRRFAFYEMKPGFDTEGFRKYRIDLGNSGFDKLIQCVEQLNAAIAVDESLGEGFCIGHSYFCNLKEIKEQTLSDIVEYELIPLLKEYWFDEPVKVRNWSDNLRSAIK